MKNGEEIGEEGNIGDGQAQLGGHHLCLTDSIF